MRNGQPFAALRAGLAGLARRFRGGASPDHAEQTYRRQVRAYLLRALAAYDRWLGVSRDLGAPDQLANAASVHRWEYLSWHEQLAGVTPPAALERLHLQVLYGLHDAARASQRLALGYRATTYASVCEGQALLSDAADSLRRSLQAFGRADAAQESEVAPAAAMEQRAS